jgi:hypothetical protein
MGDFPPSLLNSFQMQAFRYTKKYSGKLPGFDVQYKLLPREGTSGQHIVIRQAEQELAT